MKWMKNFETRKFMAVIFAAAYVIYTAIAMFTGTAVPETFITIVASVVAYYFGKSTALETPQSGAAIDGNGGNQNDGN